MKNIYLVVGLFSILSLSFYSLSSKAGQNSLITKAAEIKKVEKTFHIINIDKTESTYSVANLDNVKPGVCLVKYDTCAIYPQKREEWEKNKPCPIYSQSLKINQVGKEKYQYTYWAGTNPASIIGEQGELDINFEIITPLNLDLEPEFLFVVRNCEELSMEYMKQKEKNEKKSESYVLKFQSNQCVTSLAQCKNSGEE